MCDLSLGLYLRGTFICAPGRMDKDVASSMMSSSKNGKRPMLSDGSTAE